MSLLLTVGRSDVMENAASANLMPLPWLLPYRFHQLDASSLAIAFSCYPFRARTARSLNWSAYEKASIQIRPGCL